MKTKIVIGVMLVCIVIQSVIIAGKNRLIKIQGEIIAVGEERISVLKQTIEYQDSTIKMMQIRLITAQEKP